MSKTKYECFYDKLGIKYTCPDNYDPHDEAYNIWKKYFADNEPQHDVRISITTKLPPESWPGATPYSIPYPPDSDAKTEQCHEDTASFWHTYPYKTW